MPRQPEIIVRVECVSGLANCDTCGAITSWGFHNLNDLDRDLMRLKCSRCVAPATVLMNTIYVDVRVC